MEAARSNLEIKLWGVRGSLPRPPVPTELRLNIEGVLREFAGSGQSVDSFLSERPISQIGGYGGNTTCVEVRGPEGELIVDAGSGLRELGSSLLRGPLGKGQGEAHILMTHFHWDHLIGLPFFVPIFIPGNKIHFYGVQSELEDVVRLLFKKPMFPVDFDDLGADIHFHAMVPRRTVSLRGIGVTPYELDHPDPCWGYRFERNGSSYAHCVDTECTRQTPEELGLDRPLYQGADLMLFDAQYTLSEIVDKGNWGHAVASFGIDLALREGIKKIWFVHHDPYAADKKIDEAARQASAYYESRVRELEALGVPFQPVDWSFAFEGIEAGI